MGMRTREAVGVTETGEETWTAAGSRVGMEEHGASHLLTQQLGL